MINPLFVPGHPVDNQPTDDYWPHLDGHLDPVVAPVEGGLAGPVAALRVTVSETADSSFAETGFIESAMVGWTDRRVLVLGGIGHGTPPDRRMMGHFRYECCAEIAYQPQNPSAPARLSLIGVVDESDQRTKVRMEVAFTVNVDASAVVKDVLRRIANRAQVAGLVDPSEEEFFAELAGGHEFDEAEGFDITFPRCRPIALGHSYELEGSGSRELAVDPWSE